LVTRLSRALFPKPAQCHTANLGIETGVFIVTFACLFATAAPSFGQTATATGQLLSPVTVQGTVEDHNVLPTDTDFSDAFGLDLPVTDVPRSVSVIITGALKWSGGIVASAM
jgi:hypothetical protein